MGSYGIGPARIVAAAIEQFADDSGISWPRAVAPFDVELVTLGKEGEEAREIADRLYDELREHRARRPLRRPRPERRGEVRRRRAARLPAAAHGRQEGRRGRRARGAGPARPGAALASARGRRRGGGRAVAEPPIDASRGLTPPARSSRLGRLRRVRNLPATTPLPIRLARPRPEAPCSAPHVPAAGRPRPLRRSAPRDPARRGPPSLDDPQRDRLRPPRADSGLLGRRARVGRRAFWPRLRAVRRDRLERLPGRHGGARHGPVQPAGRAARPAHRPPARDRGRDRRLGVRPAAALGPARAGRARGAHARADPDCAAAGPRPQRQHARAVGRCGRR